MARLHSAVQASELAQVLPGFEPLPALWHGESPPFPSESSARWVLKTQRQALIDAGALALYRGCVCVHREKFLGVVRERAQRAYRERFSVGHS